MKPINRTHVTRRRRRRRARARPDAESETSRGLSHHPRVATRDPDSTILRKPLTDRQTMTLQAVPVEALRLSPWATRLFEKLRWRTALDIAVAPAFLVLQQENCGSKTVGELRNAVLNLLETDLSQHSVDDSIAGRPLTRNEAHLLGTIPVDSLELSVRATHLLEKVGWHTAHDIAAAPVFEAMAQRNCGRKTVLELRKAVLAVLETLGNDTSELSIPPSLTGEISTQPPPQPPIITNTAISGRQLTDGEFETLRVMPLAELGLSVRAKHVIEAAGWDTPLLIALAPVAAALAQRNCGRKTVAELRRTIARVLAERAAGDPEISLDPDRIRAFIDDMTGSLGERPAFVLRERFGLWDGTGETLDDIGNALGVTRARVGQIEAKSLPRLREGYWRRPGLSLLNGLRERILSAGISSIEFGVLSHDELKSFLDPDLDASQEEGQRIRLLAFRFLCEVFAIDPTLETRDLLTSSDGLLFISREGEERFRKIETAARTFLTSRGRPVQLFEAVTALRAYGVETTEPELDRFGDVSSAIGVDSSNSLGLRRWKFFRRRNLAAVVHRVLIELSQPTHFSYIADRVNAIAPDRRHRTPQAIASMIQRYPDVFVGLGRGIYGLRDWGISRPPFIKDFLVREIQNHGGKARVSDLVALGSQRYAFKATSISMTLSMNPQVFRDLGRGWYGLA